MRKELKKLSREELCSLILELRALRKENADFLKLKLVDNTDEAVVYYKKRIKDMLWQEQTNLREARKSISDFKRISKTPEQILELMIFYVEMGVEMGEEYGDMYEAFYSSMESMFEQIIKMLNNNTHLTPTFSNKLNSIVERSCEGWGHKDTLEDIYEGLSEADEE